MRRHPGSAMTRRSLLACAGSALLAPGIAPALAAGPEYPTIPPRLGKMGPLPVAFVLDGNAARDIVLVRQAMIRYLSAFLLSDAPQVVALMPSRSVPDYTRSARAMVDRLQARAREAVSPPAEDEPLSSAIADPGKRSAAATIATFACVVRWYEAMAIGAVLASLAVKPQEQTIPAFGVESAGLAFSEAVMGIGGKRVDIPGPNSGRQISAFQLMKVAVQTQRAFDSLAGTPAAPLAGNLQMALGYPDLLQGKPPVMPAAADIPMLKAANVYAEQILFYPACRAIWPILRA